MFLYLKWINNKEILYSTWNSTQCYVPAWMGGGLGGEWAQPYLHTHGGVLCCSPEAATTFLIGYTPTQNKKFKV